MSDASVAVGQDQDMPRVRPVNTAEAMRLAGIDNPATFRKAMARERAKKRDYQLPREQWDDQRTPKWDGNAIATWAAGRLGRAEKKEADQ